MTPEQAKTELVFHYGPCYKIIGPRGRIRWEKQVYKRNGQVKDWGNEFEVPLRRGWYDYRKLTHLNISKFHTEADCTVESGYLIISDYHLDLSKALTPGILGFKFIRDDWKSLYGRAGKWRVGKAKIVCGNLKMCGNGFHQSPSALMAYKLSYGLNLVLCVTEGSPECIHGKGKSCHRWMRVLWAGEWNGLGEPGPSNTPPLLKLVKHYYPQWQRYGTDEEITAWLLNPARDPSLITSRL